MTSFAVRHGGLEEGQGSWVLAIDPVGERLLLSDGDGSLHWHALADCKFIKASTPDMPRAVIVVAPQQQIVRPAAFGGSRNGHI